MKESSFPEQNSTNFISQINQKFEKYRIPKEGEPAPKFSSAIDSSLELFSYQKLLEEYLSPKSPYRGLLVYHQLGSGKTLSAINVAENSKRKVIVLLPRSLRQNFVDELIKFVPYYSPPNNYEELSPNEKEKILKSLLKKIKSKYTFITSNSGKSAQHLLEVGADTDEKSLGNFAKDVGSLDNKLLIVDETHDLINTMINPDSKNGTRIYNMIMNARNLRILFLTGTVAVNEPFEFAVLFNMLRGFVQGPPLKAGGKPQELTLFPDFDEFHRNFVDEETNTIKNKHIFQERIVGLVSFYRGLSGENLDRSLLPFRYPLAIERVPMSEYQWSVYSKARRQEQDEERKAKYAKKKFVRVSFKKPARKTATTFRVRSRQTSNFALPAYIERPELKQKEKADVLREINLKMLNAIKADDLTKNLGKYSPKMDAIFKAITTHTGNMFVYTNFVSLEGVGIFARVLEAHGYHNFNKTRKTAPNTFAILSGETPEPMRNLILKTFNSLENKRGALIKILLATSTASQGLNLMNVREVHIMEPYWNAMRVQQILGRAVRINSHANLPKEEREVKSFIYLSVPPKGIKAEVIGDKTTTDEYLLTRAFKNQKMLDSFLRAIREVAIDCSANYEHNKGVIDECRLCVPNDKPMFPPKVEDHLLPNASNCVSSKTIATGLKTINFKGQVYKMDENGTLYSEVKGQKGVWLEDKRATKEHKELNKNETKRKQRKK